jgi:hypothetical protein
VEVASAEAIVLPTDYTLDSHCMDEGAALVEGESILEMPSGHFTVTHQRVIVGDVFVTAAEAESVRSLLTDPSFGSFMNEKLSSLHGEGSECTLTLSGGGRTRTQRWSKDAKLSPTAKAVSRKLDEALGPIARRAMATSFGGDCTADTDCHAAQGPDCKCVASGPGPIPGLSKCLVFPCAKDQKVHCEPSTHHCVAGGQ